MTPSPAGGLQAAIAGALAALWWRWTWPPRRRPGRGGGPSPVGRELLAADASLGRPWPGFADAAHDLVHGWQTWLRTEARGRGAAAVHDANPRCTRTGATVLLATIAAVAPPADEIAGSGRATVDACARWSPIRPPRRWATGPGPSFSSGSATCSPPRWTAGWRAISRLGVDPGLAARLRDGAAVIGVAGDHAPALSEAA